MKVCVRTNRLRRSAARCPTRNPSNRRAPAPAQNGPAPADEGFSPSPPDLILGRLHNLTTAQTGAVRPLQSSRLNITCSRRKRVIMIPHPAPAMPLLPFSPDFKPLQPPPAGLSLTIITPGPQERP